VAKIVHIFQKNGAKWLELRDVKKVLLEQLIFAVENVKKIGGKRGFWMNMQEI